MRTRAQGGDGDERSVPPSIAETCLEPRADRPGCGTARPGWDRAAHRARLPRQPQGLARRARRGGGDRARASASANPDAVLLVHPISDGGEGLIEVVRHRLGGRDATARVSDPLGRPVDAAYLVLDDGTAIVESAQAIGLTLLARRRARSVRREQPRLRRTARGGRRRSRRSPGSSSASAAWRPSTAGLGMREAFPALGKPVTIASDVRNPLLGERGAAAVFGPQKGAAPDDIPLLEARLAALGFPPEVAQHPGAGAAGGLGAMLLSMGAELVSGIDLVLELTGWHEQLRGADLVITGEGSVDGSTADGKAVSGIVAAASGAGVPVVVFGGLVDPDAAERSAGPRRRRGGRPERRDRARRGGPVRPRPSASASADRRVATDYFWLAAASRWCARARRSRRRRRR